MTRPLLLMAAAAEDESEFSRGSTPSSSSSTGALAAGVEKLRLVAIAAAPVRASAAAVVTPLVLVNLDGLFSWSSPLSLRGEKFFGGEMVRGEVKELETGGGRGEEREVEGERRSEELEVGWRGDESEGGEEEEWGAGSWEGGDEEWGAGGEEELGDAGFT